MTKVKPPPSKLQPVIRGHVDPAHMHMGPTLGPTTTGPSRLSMACCERPARRLSGGYRPGIKCILGFDGTRRSKLQPLKLCHVSQVLHSQNGDFATTILGIVVDLADIGAIGRFDSGDL
jgi:hypothetical protein